MQLPANLGATDRLLRGSASLLMGLVGAMLLLTSDMGSCLLSIPLRLSTHR